MPVMGGLEALGMIRELDAEVPTLLMSGFEEDAAGEVVDPRAFLRKPFSGVELVRLVGKVIASPPLPKTS